MLERLFKLRENGTTWRREVLGGLTTFMTMAYILFVQPVILGQAGMDPGSVLVATCLASAVAIFLMGLTANYPIALAPGMGHNVFFSLFVVTHLGYTWQAALGATFISGMLFILLAFFGLRERLIQAVPISLKHAIGVGIGLLIAMVGLQWSGLVIDQPGTLVGLGDLSSAPVLLSLFGVAVTAVLLSRGFQLAVLAGILATLGLALLTGMVRFKGIISAIPSLQPTLFQMDIGAAFASGMVAVVFVFFFLDLFDTVGTLIGVGEQGGFLREDGSLPRARQALLSDAAGTVVGAALGTSTVTSYIESASGISAGARTGLANMVTGTLFLLALFLFPLVEMIGGGVELEGGARLYPVIAPALIVVGALLLKSVRRIQWDDFTEGFPAFLTIVMMPLTFSITEGIAFGFISFVLLKTLTGKWAEIPWLVRLFAALFVLRYAFL